MSDLGNPRVTDPFSDRLQAWRAYTATPWATIRYEVVAEILRRHVAELRDRFGRRLRILDVGGGDGLDAVRLAAAGHDVTIADPSAAWLAEARRRAAEAGVEVTTVERGLDDLPPGTWDLVLCHFVLRYRPAEVGDIGTLAARVRTGGRLSVMDVNPDGRVLRQLLTGGPAAAQEELEADVLHTVTFDAETRKLTWVETSEEIERAGLRTVGLYGNRVANDLLIDDAPKHDPAFFDDLLALELTLADREPFNRVGFAWQLLAERPA